MNVSGPMDVIDSHTEGEPTRVVIGGWPLPQGTTVAERLATLRREHDHLRRAVVLEPRGHDAVVGALLLPPDRPEAVAGVVFFNDVSWLGMCGHGLIGLVRTLEHLGRIGTGRVEIDTPVGPVSATLEPDGAVTIRNVPSRVYRTDVVVDVPGIGRVTGDVAWGGNWFFLTTLRDQPLELARRAELLRVTTAIRDALVASGTTGEGGALIDHIELFGPPARPDADARNFVLCPGNAYDRSPCGTGTSAKMAVLHHHGALSLGEMWRQESIIGSRFTGWLDQVGSDLIPSIRGQAWITSRATLLFDPSDPYALGLG